MPLPLRIVEPLHWIGVTRGIVVFNLDARHRVNLLAER
jgi:hypothetical protein